MNQKHKFAVIMAGGVGSRFWPVSTKSKPKQFIDILGTGKSLLRQTYDRFLEIIPAENIFVVTNEIYIDLVKEHIPGFADSQIISEPFAKNTAPCIAYATQRIKQINPDAVCVVAPSDHLILDNTSFYKICEEAISFSETNDALLCIGIKPHRPDTGYGYIQYLDESSSGQIYPVKTFTEKPDLELAKTFLESGDFLWNAGIFVWHVNSILHAFEKYLPEMYQLFENVGYSGGSEKEKIEMATVYQLCNSISIDYGILEKADNAFVLPGDFGWSDLGTWASLYDVFEKDSQNNAVNGSLVNMVESSGNMVCVPHNRMVVVNGVNDLIIVESDKVLLITERSREQEVKKIVAEVKQKYGEGYL